MHGKGPGPVCALGFGGPERARHDSPGQRPGLNAPMISSPEGAAPLARENGPMTETGDTHVSLSMPRTKSRCPPTPAPHTPQLEKGMCTVRISAEALALRRNLITTMGVPQWRPAMAAPCASVGPPFQGFKFCWDLFPGRCPGLAWAAPLGRKIAVSVKLGFGVGW